MANEVLVLTTDKRDGVEDYTVLFFYRINPVVRVSSSIGGDIVVRPTPSSGLPAIVYELQLMSQGQKDLLDSGDYAFEQVVVTRHKGESLADMTAKLQKQWAAKEGQFIENLRVRFGRTGQVVNI